MTTLDRDAIFLYGVTMGSFISNPLPLTRKAVTFASACHKGEFRDDNKPYISHPLSACKLLIILGVEDDVILASIILHDVVENHHTTLDVVLKEFGGAVADIVDRQTKKEKGEETLAEYFVRLSGKIESVICKGADRLNNISNVVGIFELPRLKRYIEETEQYVVPMLKEVRYVNLKYANILVMLYDSIKSIIKITKQYIEVVELNERSKL